MAGIYGDMLLGFAEQQRNVAVYDMKPRINGGWDIVEGPEISVIGVFQNTGGSRIKDGNGNLVQGNSCELWTSAGNLDGKFIKKDGSVFRLTGGNDWSFEGGFYRYSLEKVVGNDATESDNAAWNLGGNSFC